MKLAEHPGETSEEQQYDKPTYLKAHVKHMDTETLEAFNLPWEWDDRDSSYIIIKQWLNEDDQERLFEDSRERRHQRELASKIKRALPSSSDII
ncbi:MAG: hypothetical protein L6R36_009316 [Xanthoria steineri]|nr:MAG: hypothetical protein L6R36_009316 [Xanthoria steineri]